MKRHIPNILTVSRIPAAAALIPLGMDKNAKAMFFVFAAALMTDWIDGMLARAWNVTSDFGALVDPLGDGALFFGGVFGLWFAGYISGWFIVAGALLGAIGNLLAFGLHETNQHKATKIRLIAGGWLTVGSVAAAVAAAILLGVKAFGTEALPALLAASLVIYVTMARLKGDKFSIVFAWCIGRTG